MEIHGTVCGRLLDKIWAYVRYLVNRYQKPDGRLLDVERWFDVWKTSPVLWVSS